MKFMALKPEQSFDPGEWLQLCVEEECSAVFADKNVLPEDFFDLSTGAAGEVLHRFSIYHIKLAAVVPDMKRHSEPFQAFAREANRGNQFRFFETREDALTWLSEQ